MPDIPDGAAVDDAPFTDDLPVAVVDTVDGLGDLLRTVRRRAGLSLRTLEASTRHDSVPLHKSTIAAMLKGTRLPEKTVMLAFLRACGVQDEQLDPWRRAWERIADARARAQQLPVDPSRPVLGSIPRAETIVAPTDRNPTVRRRELGAMLRALRNEQGLTVEHVAERLLCSPSKVSRMETGRRGITSRDLRDLCDLYGITDQAERTRLRAIAEEGRQQAWWATYNLGYSRYVGLEAAALAIRGYQSSVVPALLQTRDYAHALLEGSVMRHSPEVVKQRVDARLIRQQLLAEKHAPRFWEVLDESVLYRLIGGPGVMRDQLDRLMEASRLPTVTVQVVPFAVGVHPGLESNFKIVDLPPPAPPVVLVEGLTGVSYQERPEDIANFEVAFEQLKNVALKPADTIELIARVRNSLGLPRHIS